MNEYPTVVYNIWEEESGTSYCIAYLPDFGEARCSAVGSDQIEAVTSLKEAFKEVIQYMTENRIPIPEPNSSLQGKSSEMKNLFRELKIGETEKNKEICKKCNLYQKKILNDLYCL